MPAKKKTGRIAVTAQEGKASAKEKSLLHVNGSTSKEAIVVSKKKPANFKSLQTMKDDSELRSLSTRRSSRLHQTAKPVGVQVVKPVVEQTVVEKDKEGASHDEQAVDDLPVVPDKSFEEGSPVDHDADPSENDMTLEEKIDYLVQSVDEFKAQGFGQAPEKLNEGESSDFSYKTLYFDSQNKVQQLLEENFVLIKRLEFARGKVAAYENMKDAMGGARAVQFVRATEPVVVDSKNKSNNKKRKS